VDNPKKIITQKKTKHFLPNEYDFDKIQYSKKNNLNSSPKIYKTGSSKKNKSLVKNKLSNIKSTSKNPKRMLNLVRLSSSHYSNPKLEQITNKSIKRKTNKEKSASREISRKKNKNTYKYSKAVSNLKELKKKHKESMIYRSKTRPVIQVDNNFQSYEKYSTLNETQKDNNYTSNMILSSKLNSKKKAKNKNIDNKFKLIYSIPELNKEITKKRKNQVKIKHKKIVLDRKPLGFKMRNGLNNTYSGQLSVKTHNRTSNSKNSKSRREYMGNFF
jgi:hypothetical protein